MTAPEPAPDPPVRADEGKKRKRREPGPKEPKEPKERKERIQYPRSCPHCGKSFPTSTRYHKHVYFHTAERKFKCDHPGCEKSYKRKVDLQDHQAVHLAVKPFRCVASACCGKTFARKCDLMNHVKFAHNGLTCEACGLRFRKKSKLEKHWKLVHPNAVAGEKVAPGICPECGKEYANYRQLLRHIQAQHGKKDKKYKCNSCDETFSTFLEMVRHRKAKHPKTYACEKCGLVYKSSDQLKRHKNAAHDDVVVRCPHVGCDFTFMSRPAMKLHFRVVHQQMKDFKCRHCQKDFAYKNVLRRHIRNVHKLEPPPEDLEPSRSSGSDGLQ